MMMFARSRSAAPEPVPLTATEAGEVKGGFLLLALLSCTGCPDGTGSQKHAGDTGGSGS